MGDGVLHRAAMEVVEGRFEADLGGGVVKKRIAREGSGKSGGFRTILLLRSGSHLFYAFGFAKNERSNIARDELEALRALADVLLALSEPQIARALEAGELSEVVADDDTTES